MSDSRFSAAAHWPPPIAQTPRVGLPPPDLLESESGMPQGGWQRPEPLHPRSAHLAAGEQPVFATGPAAEPAAASPTGSQLPGVVGHIEPLHLGSPQPPALVEWLRRSRRPLWAWTPRMWMAAASSVMLCVWGGWLL